MQLVFMRQTVGAVSVCESETAFTKQQGVLVCRLPVGLLSYSLLFCFTAAKEMRRESASKPEGAH